MMDITTLIGYLINPVSVATGWFAGTRQRKNSAIKSLQETIQLLSNTIQEDNNKIVELLEGIRQLKDENMNFRAEIKEVRRENADLKDGQKELLEQIEALKTENRELNELIRSAGISTPRSKRNQKPKTEN